VTSGRVREALESIGTMVTNLVLAIRAASAVTLISAILVLVGALAAGIAIGSTTRSFSRPGATRARLLAPTRWNT